VAKFSVAAFVAASTFVSTAAFAQDVTIVDAQALTAPVYGSADVVIAVPRPGDVAVQSVDAVEYVEAAAPTSDGNLDMSGADGSLRACYANGGIAKQRQDFTYFCNYEQETAQASAAPSPYSLAADEPSSYQGTTNIADEALIDCVNRGGTLIQLAANEQFACAM
jgi:hypothetical protein